MQYNKYMRLIAFIIIALSITLTNAPFVNAQETSADFWLGGSVKIGSSVNACTPSIEGALRYSAGELQLCDGERWNAGSNGGSGPSGCPNIGDTCVDGSVYAGLSPDGNVPMYTTPADAPGTMAWTASSYAFRGLTSTITGEANTAALTTPGNHPAAQYCAGLVAHTYDDWYLPASDEIWVLETNSDTGALAGTLEQNLYWTTTENSQFVVRSLDKFGSANIGTASKGDTWYVRCVRKAAAAVPEISADFGAGSVRVGYSGLTCNGANEGVIRYVSSCKKMEFCNGTAWSESADACSACGPPPAIGTTCGDGSVYAGLSPDGNVPMYTTPADAGQFTWNDGSANYVDTAMVNCAALTEPTCDTGEANTALLVGLGTSPSPAPYVAARHCDNLTAHGHSDWYLPARNELNVLRTNRTVIGGFNLSNSYGDGWYWSSSEVANNSSHIQRFGDGFQGPVDKFGGVAVRCVRK